MRHDLTVRRAEPVISQPIEPAGRKTIGGIRPKADDKAPTRNNAVTVMTEFARMLCGSGYSTKFSCTFLDCIMTDRVSIAIECHRLTNARFVQTGAGDDYELMARAFGRLATIAETSAGAAAIAAYVASLLPPNLPDGWLKIFLRTIARCARQGGAVIA